MKGATKEVGRLRQLPWEFEVSWSAVSRWVRDYRMQKAASAGAKKDGRASRIRHVEKEPARRPRELILNDEKQANGKRRWGGGVDLVIWAIACCERRGRREQVVWVKASGKREISDDVTVRLLGGWSNCEGEKGDRSK